MYTSHRNMRYVVTTAFVIRDVVLTLSSDGFTIELPAVNVGVEFVCRYR